MTDATPWFAKPRDLNSIQIEIWQRLVDAVGDPNAGWRIPVMATATAVDDLRQRIVVLRDVDAKRRTLFIHTDVRSSKIQAINRNPRTSWLLYDASHQVQVQLTGVAEVHIDDDVADRLWDGEAESSLRGYLGPQPPGTPVSVATINIPDEFLDRLPNRDQLGDARKNFAVISCEITSAEWLLLNRDGNLRAVFQYADNETAASWMVP